MLPDLTPIQWLLVITGAAGIGITKAGFSGVGFVHLLIFAFVFGPRESTGLILPMLVVGDVLAVIAFRQHARWDYMRHMLPPACLGVIVGALVMWRVTDDSLFRPLMGWILMALTVMQLAHMARPQLFAGAPHSRPFAWAMGLLAGWTTMLANGAGPIITLFTLAIGLPKFELVGTGAWFFLIMNAFKLPFSYALGLIGGSSLALNLVLIPPIVIGIVVGRWLTHAVPQRLFNAVLLVLTAVAALRLVWG
ncbi:MAG: hypothetical protein ABS36_12185 [Acidobacteria bacterium SCN 69-37]|nr:MAG: hypothetical protein ABS36_12185 [Acidobacteria bacterium SCN 69-37]